jgi:HEAT repeat protein
LLFVERRIRGMGTSMMKTILSVSALALFLFVTPCFAWWGGAEGSFEIPQSSLRLARKAAAEELARRPTLASRRPTGLGDVSSPEAIQHAAAAALTDLADPAKRDDAYQRLKYLGDEALGELIRGMKSDDVQLAAHCANLLEFRGLRAVAPLAEAVRSNPHPSVRQAAVGALAMTFQPASVEPLIVALDDADPNVRAAAASSIKYLRDARALAPLEKHVADPGYGHVAADAIKHIKQPQGYAWWPPELLDVKQLWHDAQALRGESFGEAEIARLESQINSEHWTVASDCLLALGSVGSRRSVPAIQTAKSTYKYLALAQIGTPEAIDFVIAALQSPDKEVRRVAIDELASGGGRWAAPLLIALLDDASLAVPAHKDLPSIEWPASHRAHSALFNYLSRFGLPGKMVNLYNFQTNDVAAETESLRIWWEKHGRDFMSGHSVPNPDLTTVMYLR